MLARVLISCHDCFPSKMNEISVKAFAKLNLALDVLSKLEDGYHAMRMVMQSVGLCDDVQIVLREDGVIRASTDDPQLPTDDGNIIVRAARLFFQQTGQAQLGADIHLTKRIPVCAGMGGGSSDGAAVLRGLNQLTGAGLSRQQLQDLSFQIGADLPFCIAGGTQLAEGKGERLTVLPAMPACDVVICKPDFAIATPMLFRTIDGRSLRCRPDIDGMITVLTAGNLSGIASLLSNVFTEVLTEEFTEIHRIRRELLNAGAMGAVMTGTGSAVFGLFDSTTAAQRAYMQLSMQYPFCCHTVVTPEIQNF